MTWRQNCISAPRRLERISELEVSVGYVELEAQPLKTNKHKQLVSSNNFNSKFKNLNASVELVLDNITRCGYYNWLRNGKRAKGSLWFQETVATYVYIAVYLWYKEDRIGGLEM